MRLAFDRGTILLCEPPNDVDPRELPGVLWDARVEAWRAPARMAYPLAAELRRRSVRVLARPEPRIQPPAGFRSPALRGYQEAALCAWTEAGRRGVIALPTGSGKTQLAIAAMARTRTPALCLVPTRALLEQWLRVLRSFYDGPIGCFGDGEKRLAPVTVATFASAYRYMAMLGDRFGLLVVDEAHHFGNARYDEALEMAIAPVRLGLTATPPGPGPIADRLHALLGPVVFQLQVDELVGEVLAPFSRITQWLRLDPDERARYDALARLYRGIFAALRLQNPHADWRALMQLAARHDDGRRAIAAWQEARRILAYPRCKARALGMILDKLRARKTLVFVSDNETAYRVAREHLVMPITCEVGRVERARVLAAFQKGELRALVSAQVLNEGIDVPDAEAGIVVGGRQGQREHIQRVGRLLRPAPGKRALVYELVVQGSAEVRQAERRWGGHAA